MPPSSNEKTDRAFSEFRERIDDVFGESVGDEILRRVETEIAQR